MEYQLIDISSGAITLALAAVLLCLKMPHDRNWLALRRMLRLLAVGYVCIGVSNLLTGGASICEAANTEIGVAILLVSFFQALFLTATCLVFVSPRSVSVGWLAANILAVSAVCCASICVLVCCERDLHMVWLADILLYAAQLVYYCCLFRRCYVRCVNMLEDNYDEELSNGLPWIRNCFLGALAVGLSALLFVAFRCGGTLYIIFTVIYTLYYIYLVVCVVNYRIEAGYIVKVVANEQLGYGAQTDSAAAEASCAATAGADAERRLSAAIEKWVEEKRYVQNDQTVEEIARGLGTTHMMLKWYFANRMHVSFRTWRLNLRVEEAKRLLKDENVPASSVHTMVGVADKSNFHKLFRKQVGMTPRQYKDLSE